MPNRIQTNTTAKDINNDTFTDENQQWMRRKAAVQIHYMQALMHFCISLTEGGIEQEGGKYI